MGLIAFGVYSSACHGLTDDEAERFLLKTFDDYGPALKYAESVGRNTAIHFTAHRKNHISKAAAVVAQACDSAGIVDLEAV